MKKLFAFMLIVFMIASSIGIIPASAEPVVTYYVNHDFNSMTGGKQITITNIAADTTTQKQYEILGESYPWRTTTYTGTPSFSYDSDGDTITGIPQPYHNTTGYISTSGKNNKPYMSMEMKNPVTGSIEATSGHFGSLYIDLRIKRAATSDNTDLNFYDSTGKTIATLYLPNGGSPSQAPRINGTSTTTGTPTTTTIANAQSTNWWYYRVILDFNTHTQQAFIGETLNTLAPFRSDTSSYSFYNTSASDFYKVTIGAYGKSAFSFDDFRVYSVSGVALPSAVATMTGKIYIGEQLSGTYTYNEPSINEAEGNSIGYWESSDTSTFGTSTKLSNDIPMKAEQVSTYTLTENDRGKYIRFCVIPKSLSGEVGHVAVSNATAPIGIYNIPFVNISPGRSEAELNATWYSAKDFTTAMVQVAPKTEAEGSTFPAQGIQSFAGTQVDTGLEYMSNKVVITDLTPNTEYIYRVGDGVLWSPTYTYRTGDLRSFDFIFTSDTHIGASGSADNDAIAWADTLTKAKAKYPNASFLLSSGDQADGGTDYQFNKFFESDVLRSLPIAAVGGSNHDDVTNFKYHFNQPNLSTYGASSSGNDYYFTYGDALFMVLNTNNHSSDTHKTFMRQTIAANPNYKWKFVMFHHSIFSACTHSTSSYIIDFRNNLAPEFTNLKIDAVFSGHDHGYVRTYIMNGLIPQLSQTVDEDGRIVNATGVQYFTANSSSGSKYYDLVDPVQPWAQIRSQLYKPSFSGISIKGNALTLNTYRTDTMEIMDSVTLCKEDAVPVADANILLSADKGILPISGGEIHLSLGSKQGSNIDLSNANITYETTEDGTLVIDDSGKVTLKSAPQSDKTFRVWAKATIGAQTYVSNPVTVQVKNIQPDFNILTDQITFIGKKNGVENPIPADAQSLPDIDTLIVNVKAVKNQPTEKNLSIIVVLYDENDNLVSLVINKLNETSTAMEVGMEYPVQSEIRIPQGANTVNLSAKVFFWSDFSNQVPICDSAKIAG